jgi:hypothetical protein
MSRGGGAHDLLRLIPRLQQRAEAFGNFSRIARVVHDERTHPGRQQFSDARLRTDQHADAACHRFHHDIAKGLEERRQRHRVGGVKELLDLAHRAKETHARVNSKPMSEANIAGRRAVGAGDQQVRTRFDRRPCLQQRSQPLARETVTHERDHRSTRLDFEHLAKACALSGTCGMEAFEIDTVIQRHSFIIVESELVD